MESQDDPEKRIRDLERPLADTARASELGSAAPYGGQAYPPPPGPVPPPPGPVPPPPGSVPPPLAAPPYNYGGPYPTASPKSGGGNRLWWILGTVVVVGALVLAGVIAAFAAHQLSGVRSIISSATSTAPQVTIVPKTSPHSPTPSRGGTPTATAGPSTPPLPPLGGQLSVSGISENKTIACNDSAVTVSGISNTIVIVGHCASLTVSGMKNSVTVDAADSIEASGINNQVTFHSGSPQVSNSGEGNTVNQG
jgi:hypothetical protein